jgi:flagellar protein FlaG
MDITSTTQTLPVFAPAPVAPASGKDGNRAPPAGRSLPTAAPPVSVERAVAEINSYLGQSQRELNFTIDRASGRTVIKVVNPNSGEVIRQIPSEEVLKMAAALARDAFHTFEALA